MSVGESIVQSLLSGQEFGDNRLYSLLLQMAQDLYRLDNQINPPTVVGAFGLTGQIVLPNTVTGLTATLFNNNLRLSWDALGGLISYEVRYISGNHTDASWNTASVILKTGTTSANINPLTIPLIFGDHTFLVKSVDSNGKYSDVASYVVVNIPIIQAPVITSVIVNNFVLLYWTAPTSVFLIDHYNIYKNTVLQGAVSGTFEAIFETVGGTFTYVVVPVDIVGNVGLASTGLVAIVSNPADFTLHASLTSILSGTKTNCVVEAIAGLNYLLACVDLVKTWTTHFTTPGWNTPQDQINAGYPIFIEPSLTTGEYDEVFDFGSIINNVIVVINWNSLPIVGSVTTATTTIETSTDNITYTAPVTGTSVFAAAVRYVRLKLKFVGASDKSLTYFYNIQCILNVHREQDGGTIAVLAADVGGTVVTLNKAFKSIDSIDLTPIATVQQTAIYDFAFPVNPTTFKILLYNAAGARVNGTVSWIARGII